MVALLHVLEVSLGSASVSKVEKNMLLPLQDMLFDCFSGLCVSVKGIPRDNHSLAQGMLLVEKPPLWCQPSLAFLHTAQGNRFGTTLLLFGDARANRAAGCVVKP